MSEDRKEERTKNRRRGQEISAGSSGRREGADQAKGK